MTTFDKALREVVQDPKVQSIPILFIVQIVMSLDDLNLLKEDDDYDE